MQVLGMNLDMQNGCQCHKSHMRNIMVEDDEGKNCVDLLSSAGVYSPLILIGLPYFLLWRVRVVDIPICILCSRTRLQDWDQPALQQRK